MKGMYLIVFLLVFTSCSKDEELPNKEPQIELISYAPNSIKAIEDSVTFVIKYSDLNGDLGHESPDLYSIFITDSRNNITESIHLDPLAPLDSEVAIEGEINVYLNGIGLVDQSNDSENTTFKIKLVDRKGNESNVETSGTVVINKN
jgi:hypothetical protein